MIATINDIFNDTKKNHWGIREENIISTMHNATMNIIVTKSEDRMKEIFFIKILR